MANAAALYLRSSKDRKDVSIDAQRRLLREAAAERGLAVVEEFADAVESGKDENRPGFQRLIAAVRKKARGWDTVLVLDTSRIARRRHISLIFEELECRRNGVAVVYKSLPDSDPITEMLLRSILQAMDEWHSLTSKAKGLAGMAENVHAGFRAGGRAPIGYRLRKTATGAVREGEAVTKSTLEPDPAYSEAIGAYLSARAHGIGRALAKRQAGLDAIASTTLVGIEWNALTYAGHTVWNVHAERNGGAYVGGSKRRPRSEWVIKRDTHPALIADATAERILDAISATYARNSSRSRESAAVLGGLLVAPDGRKWWAESDRYRLPAAPGAKAHTLPRHAIEGVVIDQVFADMSAPRFASALCESAKAALSSTAGSERIADIRAEVAGIAARISKALDIASQLSDPAPALRKIDELEAQRKALASELARLDAERELAMAAANVSEDKIRAILAQIAEEAKDTERGDLRSVIASLVDRIELDPETLSATLHYRIAAPVAGVKVASPRVPTPSPGIVLRHSVGLQIRWLRKRVRSRSVGTG